MQYYYSDCLIMEYLDDSIIEIIENMGSSPPQQHTQQPHPYRIKATKRPPHKKSYHAKSQHALTQQDLFNLLKHMQTNSLLSILNQTQKQSCAQYFQKWVYSQGTFLQRQYDPPQHLFIIIDGSVSIQIDCNIVRYQGKWQYFGQYGVCFNSPNAQTARVASSSATILTIQREILMKFIKDAMNRHNQSIIGLFNRIQFFNYLNSKQRQLLIDNTFLYRLQPGQILFQRNQQAYSFYIVKNGSVQIQRDRQINVQIKQREYFGQSAFLAFFNSQKPGRRQGKASAYCVSQVYAINLYLLRKRLSNSFRFIVFLNKQKWALLKNQHINSFANADVNHLLQLFSISQKQKYTTLAEKGKVPDKVYIPIQANINCTYQLKLYCSQYLLQNYTNKPLDNDITLTQTDHYAYALIQDLKRVLSISKQTFLPQNLSIKLQKQPLFINRCYSLKNINKNCLQVDSRNYCKVFLGTDSKSANDVIIRKFRKKHVAQHFTNHFLQEKQNYLQIKSTVFMDIKLKKSPSKKSRVSISGSNTQLLFSQGGIQKQIDDDFIKRYVNIVCKLNHAQMQGYYKAQQDQSHYYIFLQYFQGITLSQLISQKGKLPLKLCRYYLACLVQLCHHLHSLNIIYRGFTPDNIVVRYNGHLALVDFSCAKELNAINRTCSMIGVMQYMAPQVILKKQYSFNADLWSIGVILYQMLTGILPFSHKDPIQLQKKIINEGFNTKSVADKNALVLLQKLLQKDPSKRIQNAMQIRNQAFISDLQFKWNKFLKDELQPIFYPQIGQTNWTAVKSESIFDARTLREWS